MVNLLPEEMKKGDEDDKGFEDSKKQSKKAEKIAMTVPIKDEFPKEKKKSKGFLNPFVFIFKKREKNKDIQDKKNIVDVKKDKKNIVDVKKDKKNIVDVKKDKKKKGKEERASEDFTVSLMPRQTIIISRVVHSRLLFLMAAVIIILGLFFVSRLYGNWYFDNLEARAEYLKREIALLEIQTVPFLEDRDEIAFLANKAIKAKKALNNHVYWTNFFNLLESYTVPGVYFGDFNARARETIRLSATGRDLISLAQQIVAFDNAPDFIKDVDVSNIQKSDAGVSAFFDLTLIDSVWQK